MTVKDGDCEHCEHFVKDAYGQFVCEFDGECENMVRELTNEEWLKSLDTEGLVDYLFEVHKGGSSVERQRWIEEHKERIKMQYRGWLKAVHKDG